MNEWISVKERLPELTYSERGHLYSEMVLCYVGGAYGVGQLSKRGHGPRKGVIGFDFTSGKHLNRNITHWMPLPPPPKEVK